jgi:hypothetical protein
MELEMQKENNYSVRIPGFVTINCLTEAVVHTAQRRRFIGHWSDVEDNFFVKTNLGARLAISIFSVLRTPHLNILDGSIAQIRNPPNNFSVVV